MLTRRSFLRRTSLALPALLVGDAALEAFERLTHRKVFALGDIPLRGTYYNRLAPPGMEYFPVQMNARYSFTMRRPSVAVDDYIVLANRYRRDDSDLTTNIFS